MRKFFFAMITGLLLAGEAMAVPTLEVNLTQENWRVWLSIIPNHDGESLLYITRNGVVGDAPTEIPGPNGGYYQGWVGYVPLADVGTHLIEFHYEIDGLSFVTSGSYTIDAPTGERPVRFSVPDGGATAALLGFGFLGLLCHRRLHPAR